MSFHPRVPTSYGSDSSVSSSSSRSSHHHNNKDAPSSSSQHAPAFDDDSDDPSFASGHVVTSTPRKGAARRTRGRDQEEEDPLHASDTESLNLDEADIERGIWGLGGGLPEGARARLTRRSLAHLSATPADLDLDLASTSTTPRARFSRALRAELYAPSPSTGSSTLVDRDEEVAHRHRFDRKERKEREEELTVRRPRLERTVVEEDEGNDGRGADIPPTSNAEMEEDGSSSSPRPPRRSRVGDLASYIDARMSTPRRSPKSRRTATGISIPPATPAAPGAYPSSARKPSSRPSPSSSTTTTTTTPLRPPPIPSPRHKTPPASASALTATGSDQIHDAFKRLITGPDGVLTHSAERRAALASLPAAPSSARKEPTTPHPTGYYSFVPSSALPVNRKRGSRNRQAQEERVEEEEEEEDWRGAGLGTPSHRPASKLERALRHLSQAQQDDKAQEERVAREEYARGFASVGEQEEREERSAVDFAMARSFIERPEEHVSSVEGDSSADDRPPTPPPPPPVEQLRRSSAEFRTNASVRFAEPAATTARSRSRTPSPSPPASLNSSTSSRRQPQSQPPAPLPPRSPSPQLPPLPPPIVPDSPEPVRKHTRSSLRRAQSYTPQQLARREPLELELGGDVARPSSSTPPRRTVQTQPELEPERSPPRQSSYSTSKHQTIDSPRRLRPRTASAEQALHSVAPVHAPAPAPAPPQQQPSSPSYYGSPISPEDEANLSLPLLVTQLSAAVRALTIARDSPGQLDQNGLPLTRQNNAEQEREREGLALELTRRKKESDRRRREMEKELQGIEQEGKGDTDQRAVMLKQLAETYEVEQELGFKVDELRKSVEGMGQLVGKQVAQVVGSTLQDESRKRTHWFALALCIQIALFWLLLRITNAHSNDLFQTLYYDPFLPPALFHVPSAPFSRDPLLAPETLALFAPSGASADAMRMWVEKTARVARTWGWVGGGAGVRSVPL
ncbi:hypothetical protein JCM21900_000807 [Sporobolomyces salmonicolor]